MRSPRDPRSAAGSGIEGVPEDTGTSSRARDSFDPKLPGDRRNNESVESVDQNDHEGATEDQVGDRTGPGVGYDQEPAKQKDRGGVAES